MTRHLGTSRRSLFEEIERPALKALPAKQYEFTEWKKCRPGLDYHVEIDKHYYSVPFTLIGQEMWARYTAQDGRGVPSRQAHRRAYALLYEARTHDATRAHALEPSALL